MANQAMTPMAALPQQQEFVPANPEAAVTPEEQQAVNAIIMGVDPAKAAQSVVDTAHAKELAAAPAGPIVTSQLDPSPMNVMPTAPQNDFAAALEKQIGAFNSAEVAPVTAPAEKLSVADLTHMAVMNARGGAQSAAVAETPAVTAEPAQPLLALPTFNQQADVAMPA